MCIAGYIFFFKINFSFKDPDMSCLFDSEARICGKFGPLLLIEGDVEAITNIDFNYYYYYYYSLLFQQGIPLQRKAALQGTLHNNTDSHKHIHLDMQIYRYKYKHNNYYGNITI